MSARSAGAAAGDASCSDASASLLPRDFAVESAPAPRFDFPVASVDASGVAAAAAGVFSSNAPGVLPAARASAAAAARPADRLESESDFVALRVIGPPDTALPPDAAASASDTARSDSIASSDATDAGVFAADAIAADAIAGSGEGAPRVAGREDVRGEASSEATLASIVAATFTSDAAAASAVRFTAPRFLPEEEGAGTGAGAGAAGERRAAEGDWSARARAAGEVVVASRAGGRPRPRLGGTGSRAAAFSLSALEGSAGFVADGFLVRREGGSRWGQPGGVESRGENDADARDWCAGGICRGGGTTLRRRQSGG